DALAVVSRGTDKATPRGGCNGQLAADERARANRNPALTLASPTGAEVQRRRIPRVCRRRSDGVVARQRARDSRLPARRSPSLEARDAVSARRDQPRAECGA